MPMERSGENMGTPTLALAPASIAAGTQTSSAINCSGAKAVTLTGISGVLGASATVDCKLQASATSGGTYTDITGGALTQFVKATDDGIIREVTVDLPPGKPFVKVVTVVATATSIFGALVRPAHGSYSPPSGTRP